MGMHRHKQTTIRTDTKHNNLMNFLLFVQSKESRLKLYGIIKHMHIILIISDCSTGLDANTYVSTVSLTYFDAINEVPCSNTKGLAS
jgi:hypothetical protein